MKEFYKDDLIKIALFASLIREIDVPGHLEAIRRADAFGPILDPTAYKQNAKKMHQDRELFEAAVPLWGLADRIKSRANNQPNKEGGE